ncbi:hypothetical protein LUZ60_011036 [Juncus effusus]|nr:hypothetical protein LUZ60_011036 [Juncus effusus]
MASLFYLKKTMNHDMVIKELERGCELTAMLQAQVSTIFQDGTDRYGQFGAFFEEITRSLNFSRKFLARSSNQTLPESKVLSRNYTVNNNKRKRNNEFKETQNQRRKNCNKRREVTSMPDHDGYQWRKYGQKNIHKMKYPRCYYRCTYSQDQKCKATKTVQQSDDDMCHQPLFEVTYFDQHTCNNITIANFEPSNCQQMLDFSANSTHPKPSNFSLKSFGFNKEEEDATLVSCLTDVIKGNQMMSNNSSQLSTVSSNDDDKSSIESVLFGEDEFELGDMKGFDYFDQDDLKFFFDQTINPFQSIL